MHIYRSVLQIRPPVFATLALVQSAEEAYMRDPTFSLSIKPSILVPRPQLCVQVEEDNAFDDFTVAVEKDIYTCGSPM